MNKKTLGSLNNSYDTIIIGGGIVGAGIYRDLALHGQSVLIIDKGDFASKTSQWSSKMLHGGVRYLETFDFGLVREALNEKNLWLKLAPHLCFENKFYLPLYKHSKNKLWEISVGLKLYDLLSSFRNAPHQILNAKKLIKEVPELKEKELRGGGVYYDAVVDDAKLTLENIYDGSLSSTADALNHIEYINHSKINDKYTINLQDKITNESKSINVNNIIFAVGPYTDVLMKRIYPHWQDVMLPSKGIHLWLKPQALPVKNAFLLPLPDGRVMFVIPQKNSILTGTTETKPDGIDKPKANKFDIEYVKKHIQKFFPNCPINDEDIIATYAGIRPLVSEGGHDLGKTSREHKIFQPARNVFTIAGGKLTTFRVMGQEITESICLRNGMSYNPDKTISPLRQNSVVKPFSKNELTIEKVKVIINQEMPRTVEDLVQRRLNCFDENHWPYEINKEEVIQLITS